MPEPARTGGSADPAVVLIVAPNWLGDAVMALPAIADLRRRFAAARFVVADRATVAPLFRMVPGIDEAIVLEWRGRLLARAAWRADRARLTGVAADVALLLPNSFAAAWQTLRAAIPERWGFATDGRRRLLTRAVPSPAMAVHQGTYYQALVTALGTPAGPCEPYVQVPAAALAASSAQLRSAGWDGVRRLVAVAPGAASGTAKRWPPRYFARLIVDLTRDHGVQCVIVGSAGDADTVQAIRATPGVDVEGARAIDLTGRTSLEALAAVLAQAAVCVSNDSGAMHLAGAVGTSIVALFGPTRDTETFPLTRAGARAELLINPVWCRPCMLRECPIDHRCMVGLTPERVLATVGGLLGARA